MRLVKKRVDAYTQRRRRERARARWQREHGNKFPPRRRRFRMHEATLFPSADPEGYARFRVPGLSVRRVTEMLRLERGVDPYDPDSRPTRQFGWRTILGRMREIKLAAWDLMQDREVLDALGERAIRELIEDLADGMLDADTMRREVQHMVDEVMEHMGGEGEEVPF